MSSRLFKSALIVFISLVIIGFSFFVVAQGNSDKNIFLDSDQDGLSDDEESMLGTDPNEIDSDGDGYSDGVEVKGGYDPLIPAPGDRLTDDAVISADTVDNNETSDSEVEANDSAISEDSTDLDINVTEEASVKIADLLTSSEAGDEAITISEIENIVADLTNNEKAFEDLPEIDDDKIKIKKQNYGKYSEEEQEEMLRKDAIDYLVAVSYVAASNSPRKISNLDDIGDFGEELFSEIEVFAFSFANVAYFDNLFTKGEVALEQMIEIEVPEELVDFHKRGLQLAEYAIIVNNTTEISMEDPLEGIQNLSKIQSLVNLTMQYSEEVMSKLEEFGIGEIPIDL